MNRSVVDRCSTSSAPPPASLSFQSSPTGSDVTEPAVRDATVSCAWCGAEGVLQGRTELTIDPLESAKDSAEVSGDPSKINWSERQSPGVQERLEFCNRVCLGRYKMHLFCTETQRYLSQLKDTSAANVANQHNVENNPAVDERILITPELWTQDTVGIGNGHETIDKSLDSRKRKDSLTGDDEVERMAVPPKLSKIEAVMKHRVAKTYKKHHHQRQQQQQRDNVHADNSKSSSCGSEDRMLQSPDSCRHRNVQDYQPTASGTNNSERSHHAYRFSSTTPVSVKSENANTEEIGNSKPGRVVNNSSDREPWATVGSAVQHGIHNPLTDHRFPFVMPPLPQSFLANPFAGMWPRGGIPRPSGIPSFPGTLPLMPGFNAGWPGLTPGSTMLVPYPVPIPIPIPLPIPIPVPIPPSMQIINGKLEINVDTEQRNPQTKNSEMDNRLNNNSQHQVAGLGKVKATKMCESHAQLAHEPVPTDRRQSRQTDNEEMFNSNSTASSPELGTVLDLSSAARSSVTPSHMVAADQEKQSSPSPAADSLRTQYFIDRLVAPPYLARRSLILDAPRVEKLNSVHPSVNGSARSPSSMTTKRFHHHSRRRLASHIKTKCVK